MNVRPAIRILRRAGRASLAFTMIEVALCIGIIGLALVAILGTLPRGLNSARDNRNDSVVTQDGDFWLKTIVNGQPGEVDLPRFVFWVDDPANTAFTSDMIIGQLTSPTNTYHKAKVRSINGPIVERDKANIGFDYMLFAQVVPFGHTNLLEFTNAPWMPTNRVAYLSSNLYEVKVTIRWPLRPDGTVGEVRQVFRSLVAGELWSTNGFFFFHPRSLQL